MNIAIITPGILPCPATKGGAVESLIDFYVEENELSKEHSFIIYSVYDKTAKNSSTKYKQAEYIYINNHNIINRIKRYWFKIRNKHTYYNYYLEYYARTILEDIKQRKIDLIVIENRQGFVLQAFNKLKHIPIILHLHNDTLDFNALYAEEIVKKCHKIITVSNYIKERVETINNTGNKVVTVYNGIDTSRFNQQQSNLPRESIGFKEDDFIVVYTGRITPIKGIIPLLESFKLLVSHPKIKLLLIGQMDNHVKERFRIEFNRLTTELRGKVVVKGFVPNKELPNLLKMCNVGIIPSICEDALTLSSIENMAVGLPLIVTNSGGIPEAVNEECAIIVEKNGISLLPHRIAESILKLYNNKALLTKMSKAGIERSKLFNIKFYSMKILSVFKL